jgi:hypothetical protein
MFSYILAPLTKIVALCRGEVALSAALLAQKLNLSHH